MPYRIVAAQALARWRAAQAQMDALPQDSPGWQDAYIESELAKAAYQEAINAAHREHLPEPPAFPGTERPATSAG